MGSNSKSTGINLNVENEGDDGTLDLSKSDGSIFSEGQSKSSVGRIIALLPPRFISFSQSATKRKFQPYFVF